MTGPASQKKWRFVVRVLMVFGVVGCLVVGGWDTVLIGHYTAVRPHNPDPQKRWTVGLSWTHGAYGTAEEENRIMFLFYAFFPCFALFFLAEAIKIYLLEDYSGIRGIKGPPFPISRS